MSAAGCLVKRVKSDESGEGDKFKVTSPKASTNLKYDKPLKN